MTEMDLVNGSFSRSLLIKPPQPHRDMKPETIINAICCIVGCLIGTVAVQGTAILYHEFTDPVAYVAPAGTQCCTECSKLDARMTWLEKVCAAVLQSPSTPLPVPIVLPPSDAPILPRRPTGDSEPAK